MKIMGQGFLQAWPFCYSIVGDKYLPHFIEMKCSMTMEEVIP
jgi:hypothetical protein